MADQKSKLKLKLVLSDESGTEEDDYFDENNYDENSDDDLWLSLNNLDLVPHRKLIVLCLGGLLVRRVHLKEKHTVRGLRPDVVYGNFHVYKRPYCTEFLNFCFERFHVALWSSAREHNIEGVINNITSGKRSKFVFIWGQEECTDSGYGCIHKQEKPLFLKELKDILGNIYINKGQKYTLSNTLLIDDEPHTSLLNPPYTAIFPQQYKKPKREDSFLGPGGELRKYLEGLWDAKDVPSYVKENPFGEPAITPTHCDWKYYSKIVGKKDKGPETSSKS